MLPPDGKSITPLIPGGQWDRPEFPGKDSPATPSQRSKWGAGSPGRGTASIHDRPVPSPVDADR
jgi:hypothetical protein